MSGTQTLRRARIPQRQPTAPEAPGQRRPVVPLVLTAACLVLFLVVLVAR